jgi:exopolysaccharide production protein ExoZ
MKLNSIQFLRAVAALLVVFDNSLLVQMNYGISQQQNFLHLNKFGCIGVDLAFIICGFIITLVASKYTGASQGIHFLAKRFLRINPVYYMLSLVLLLIILFNPGYNPFPGGKPTINSIVDSLFILPTGSNLSTYTPLLKCGWALSFIWLFYLLFFLLIVCKVRHKAFSLLGTIALLVVCGIIFQPHDLRFQFITNPILLEFLLGCIISYIYLRVKQIPADIGFICLLIGVASYIYLVIKGFGIVGYFEGTLNGYLSLNRFLFWGIPSSLIVAGCVILEKNGLLVRLWNNPFLLLCGNASFSIYLGNTIVLSLLMLLYKKTGYFLPADLMIWLQMVIAVIVSIFFYKLVEKPLLQYTYRNWIWTITTYSKKAIPN